MGNESNRGEVGVESIRINGQRIGALPLGQGEIAKSQIPLALSAEKQQRIENVLARYPRVTREYAEARRREAETAIKDFQRVRQETQQKILDFTVLISQHGGGPVFQDIEEELYEIGQRDDLSFDEKKDLIAQKRAECTEYQVTDLQQQIVQFEENIRRLDDAMKAEHDSIAEMTALMATLAIRDNELKALGVTTIA